MTRMARILAQVVNKAGNPSGVGAGNMKIPGMKIGTQMAPGAPDYEDLVWMIAKIEQCRELLARVGTEEAKQIIRDIEEGK